MNDVLRDNSDQLDDLFPVVLRTHFWFAARIFFIALGALMIFLPLWELGPVVFPLTVFTPIVAIIVVGSVWLGVSCLLGGLIGDSSELRIDKDGITHWRKNLLWSKTETLTPHDIREVILRENDWEDRPTTTSVEVTLANGKKVKSAEYDHAAGAAAMADRVREALARL